MICVPADAVRPPVMYCHYVPWPAAPLLLLAVVMERLLEFRFDLINRNLIDFISIIENFDYCPALDKAVKCFI